MKAWIEAYIRLVLRHRAMFALLLLGMTTAAAMLYPRAHISTSFKAMFFGEGHPQYTRYSQRIKTFGSDVVFIVGVASPENPLSAAMLPRVLDAQKRLEAVENVRRVASVASFRKSGLVGDTIAVRDFAAEATSAPKRADALLDELREDPAAAGILISKKTPHFNFIVVLHHDEKRDAEALPRILKHIESAMTSAGFARERVHLAGMPTIIDETMRQSMRNIMEMLPIVTALLLFSIFLMFGRMWPVIVSSASAIIAVAWAMAFSIWRDPAINIFASLVPCFVLIISFSDVVHMCSAYLLELQDPETGADRDKTEAIVAAVTDVGAACFLTSLTTGVGFASMVFIPSPVFQQLGTVSFFGVTVAYLLALTMVPIMLSWLGRPEPWQDGRTGFVQRALDHLLDALFTLSTARPRAVLLLFAGVFALGVYGSTQIYFEAEFSKRLQADNHVRVDERYFQKHFDSTTFIDLYLEFPEEGALLQAETFDKLVAIERALEARPDVDAAVSIVDVLRAAHSSIVGDAPDAKPFTPSSDAALAQLLVVLEMQGPDAYHEFMDFGRRTMKMSIYTNDSGIRAQNELATSAVKIARETLGPGAYQAEAFSLSQLMGSWVDNILIGQIRGLIFSLIIIAFLLMIGFRSVRLGLVSMIPNVLPLLAMGAWCGLAWESTDTDAVLVGMIAIGIGVDDTIHFLSRYLLESKRRPRREAIRETFRFSGRGIFITTFIFTLGFCPMVRSDYLSIQIMGYLLPAAFLVALVADLMLVPAMIEVGWLAAPETSSRQDAQAE